VERKPVRTPDLLTLAPAGWRRSQQTADKVRWRGSLQSSPAAGTERNLHVDEICRAGSQQQSYHVNHSSVSTVLAMIYTIDLFSVGTKPVRASSYTTKTDYTRTNAALFAKKRSCSALFLYLRNSCQSMMIRVRQAQKQGRILCAGDGNLG